MIWVLYITIHHVIEFAFPFIAFQGIEWIHVDYFNNAVICDLIEKVLYVLVLTLISEKFIMSNVSVWFSQIAREQ